LTATSYIAPAHFISGGETFRVEDAAGAGDGSVFVIVVRNRVANVRAEASIGGVSNP
jgi:hypothetical protein